MYNLKLKRRQEKRQSTSNTQSPIILDDLSSDDEWIGEIEDFVLPSDDRWLNDLDRDAHRITRSALQIGVGENTDGDGDLCFSFFSLFFIFRSLLLFLFMKRIKC